MDTGGIVVLVAFLAFVGVVGHYRLKLDEALAALPERSRTALGIEATGRGRGAPKRRRRRVADRMTIYGIPAWLPLSEQGREALRALRLLMLGFLVVLALGPVLAYQSIWALISLPIVLVVVGARAIAVGPWPGKPE